MHILGNNVFSLIFVVGYFGLILWLVKPRAKKSLGRLALIDEQTGNIEVFDGDGIAAAIFRGRFERLLGQSTQVCVQQSPDSSSCQQASNEGAD